MAACVAAVALTVIFWGTLWDGGGVIGGDLYSYYFPQKVYYAEHLKQGEIPFWNNLAGNGYPLVAESQTGAFYPPNLLLYRLLNVNAAYNAIQILHYALAFVFTWMYARRLDLSPAGAGLAALVYTYGWFPLRMCWEWAIIGGAWLPLALWAAESFLQSAKWRYLFVLCGALSLQMLPGHYNLAFITQLTLAVYVPLRLWVNGDALHTNVSAHRRSALGTIALAGLCGFGLAAIQLLPSWELKQISQRAAAGRDFDPGYGNIPLWYLPQMVAPWWYFGDETDLNAGLAAGMSGTNKVEAHLYFGLLPLVLIAWGLWKKRYTQNRRLMLWAAIGLLAMLYTTGWFVPVAKHLPGFGFFGGPGRYGIVTTLAVGLLAGTAFSSLLAILPTWSHRFCLVLVLLGTTADLWYVNEIVSFNQTIQIADPPLLRLQSSPVRKVLAAFPAQVRLFSRGANLPTLLGVASTPAYLGIGPAAYFDPALRMPEPLPFDEPATPQHIDWLRRAGVTHVLSYIPLDFHAWPVEMKWAGYDPFLNPAWARRESLYLYELASSRGRIAWTEPQPGDTAVITEYHANRVTAEVASVKGGRLVLTDLEYPGWHVQVDNEPAAAVVVDGMYRGVDLPPGRHTIVWIYQPRSLTIGAVVSLLTLLVLAGMGHIRYWHPHWFSKH